MVGVAAEEDAAVLPRRSPSGMLPDGRHGLHGPTVVGVAVVAGGEAGDGVPAVAGAAGHTGEGSSIPSEALAAGDASEGSAASADLEATAARLQLWLAAAWRASGGAVRVLYRETASPASLPLCRRVLRLGRPLDVQLWLFGSAPALDPVFERLQDELEVLAGDSLSSQWLSAATPFPDNGVALGFIGLAPDGPIDLYVGFEPGRHLSSLPRVSSEAGVVTQPAVYAWPTTFPATRETAGPESSPDADFRKMDLAEVDVELEVFVGGTRSPLALLASLQAGAILSLDTRIGEAAVVAIKGRVVAWGEIVVFADDTLGVRVTRLARDLPPEGGLPAWMRV